MKLFISSLYERAFQTSLKSLFHSLELESKELYSAIQSLAASAHEDLQETNRLMESLQSTFSQIMLDPKLLETQGVTILKLISDTKERIKAAQYAVYGIQSGAVTLLDQI